MNVCPVENRSSRIGRNVLRASIHLAAILTIGWCALSGTPAHSQGPHRTNANAESNQTASDNANGHGDLVCGPRCVQYVLKHYRQDVDLVEVIREVQWPDLEHGATMQAMAAYLTERGIHTAGMQLASKTRLTWENPVIVHLTGESDEIGHYVVWLPSTSGRVVDAWFGLEGIRQVPEREFAGLRSGAILLTSPAPIQDPNIAVKRRGVDPLLWLVIGITCLVLLGLMRSREWTS